MLALVVCTSIQAAARAATNDRASACASSTAERDAHEPAWLAPHNRVTAVTAVRGEVADPAGHAIAGALIVSHAATALALPALAVSDRLGHFEFVGLPPGEYCFVAIHLGYAIAATPQMPVEDRLRVSITLVGGGSA